ncbi:uncharacterized protein LOC143235676 [Tachypleus tridentatus]|uniref:uncharacterized protein LOC143235676 n=1 Tax=Tachypleus tridentatus TaxID=6853 RepID=UPI003FD181AE
MKEIMKPILLLIILVECLTTDLVNSAKHRFPRTFLYQDQSVLFAIEFDFGYSTPNSILTALGINENVGKHPNVFFDEQQIDVILCIDVPFSVSIIPEGLFDKLFFNKRNRRQLNNLVYKKFTVKNLVEDSKALTSAVTNTSQLMSSEKIEFGIRCRQQSLCELTKLVMKVNSFAGAFLHFLAIYVLTEMDKDAVMEGSRGATCDVVFHDC